MIDEILTGTATSSVTTPTAPSSDVLVQDTESRGTLGQVVLEVSSDGTIWTQLTDDTGAFTVSTPDANLQYRFRAINVEGDVHVYFGP